MNSLRPRPAVKLLEAEFFDRPAVEVARDLLGKFIVREMYDGLMINETEAYEGPDDKASHARTDVPSGTRRCLWGRGRSTSIWSTAFIG